MAHRLHLVFLEELVKQLLLPIKQLAPALVLTEQPEHESVVLVRCDEIDKELSYCPLIHENTLTVRIPARRADLSLE